MKTKFELELADVKRIAAAAEAEALKNQWAVTIAIVDDSGHLCGCSAWTGLQPFPRTLRPPRRTRPPWAAMRNKVYEDVINGGVPRSWRTCRGGHTRRRCALS